MTVVPREAGESDVPAIVALVNAAFALERAFVDRDRTDATEIAAMMTRGSFFVVDDDAGRLLAAMYLERRAIDRVYLGMLSIQPSNQGRGLGRAMMAAAERRRTRGAQRRSTSASCTFGRNCRRSISRSASSRPAEPISSPIQRRANRTISS